MWKRRDRLGIHLTASSPPHSTSSPPLSESKLGEAHASPLLQNPAIIFWLMEDVLTKVDIKWN